MAEMRTQVSVLLHSVPRGFVEILGHKPLSLVQEEVDTNEIDENRLRHIAEGLSSKVGGNHKKRKEKCDNFEVSAIFRDWYEDEMYKMTRHEALEKLMNVVREKPVAFPRLATELEKCLTECSGTDSGFVTDVDLDNKAATREPKVVPKTENYSTNNEADNKK